MAKKKQTDEEALDEMMAREKNPDHFKPQEKPKGPAPRPEAVDKSHLKPQAEVKEDDNRVKAADPKHLKPQE